MSKAEFVPAIGEQFNSVWVRGLKYLGKDGKEYDMKFFTPNSFYQHNIALQSAFYGLNGVGKKAINNTYREMIGYPKDKTLIGDSGGFQLATFKIAGKECNITPIESLRWQEANCDVAMNLDVPSTLDGTPSYNDFIVALNASVENFKVFEKERKNYDMRLLNVLHGESYELASLWYDKVKDFKFDGYAVGMKPPSDGFIQALGFLFLWEKGEFKKESFKHLHFFGTSGKHVVPTMAYIASKLPDRIRVTYDSSSYNIGSIYRTYYSPFDFGPVFSFGDKFKTHNPHLKELPCMCPVCSVIKDINELNLTDIYAGTLISLHNLYQYMHYNNVLNSIVWEKEKFMEYLVIIGASKKCIKSIEFIDFALENGLQNAIKKYEYWINYDEITKTSQKGVFDY